jgi:hypothetical protein
MKKKKINLKIIFILEIIYLTKKKIFFLNFYNNII